MSRPLSYKSPSKLAIGTTTQTRHDDTDRGTLWTQSEIDWLWANYESLGCQQCAERLRRSEMSVRIKIHRLRRRIKMGHGIVQRETSVAA